MKKNLLLLLLTGSLFAWSCNNNASDSSKGDTTTTTDNMANADTTTMNNNTTTTAAPLNEADKNFVMNAASSGMMEVELGNLAQQNATNQRVKDFGSMMVRDHSAANQELKSFASTRNVMVPDSLSAEHRSHVNEMMKMKGKAFDNHYMSMMVKDHQKDISAFEKASQSATDADLKNWASKTLPVLKTHLDSAKAIKAKM